LLGPEVDPSRVLMVGDSIEHDVAGANAAGIHSLFVAGGIHAAEVGLDGDGDGGLSADALERTFETYGASPTYTASVFTW
jgi:ribonucleotide monophosphatase NagD (HAD superfamily)